MKKFCQYLMILFISAGVGLGPGVLSVWARPNPPFRGHGRDREREDRGRGHRDHEHWDNGRHRGWERDGRVRYRFDDYDRRELESYYREHRHERWFREPVPRGLALRDGYVFAPRYRRYCHPLPVVMLRVLPPPPPRCHYFLFGGNVVLLDDGYRVHDFVQLNFNIGR